jgi:hypothetical protein
MKNMRRTYNYNHQKNDPTVWYIAKDGGYTTEEKDAKNKIRRNRKFNFDPDSNRYIER